MHQRPAPHSAPVAPALLQHRDRDSSNNTEESPRGRSLCLRPERASSVSPWRTRALGEGARGGLSTATWLLTHDSTREKCRSLTHLLWRVLQTTRKAITLQVIRSTSAHDPALTPSLKSQLKGEGEAWRVAGVGGGKRQIRERRGKKNQVLKETSAHN